jgi:hydrogenase maturation protein HypF
MLAGEINSPLTSSVGRLFDAVAAIIGLRYQVQFEGQAAMELEFAIGGLETDDAYPLLLAENSSLATAGSPLVLDWQPTIEGILSDVRRGMAVGMMAAKFHNALVEGVIQIAQRAGEECVAISGGCFQNRYLTERTVARLRAEGYQPYWHQRVPTNDGGIALGQIAAALRESEHATHNP